MYVIILFWFIGAAFFYKDAKEKSFTEETKTLRYLMSPVYVALFGAYRCLLIIKQLIKKFIEI
jgi:hypothetical protein